MLRTRRELVMLGAAVVAGCVKEKPAPPAASVEEVLELFFGGRDREQVRRAGQAVLRLPRLTVAETSSLIEEQSSGTEALEVLTAQIQTDFEEPDLLIVDGWYLSRTEAHLCALAARSW